MTTKKFTYGGSQKRHVSYESKGARVTLKDHPALREGRTIFPKSVVAASDSPRLFIRGDNSRKIGKRCVKGAWSGMPFYTLTLEERATCPTTCATWATCYGNNMPFARRHEKGRDLEKRIESDVAELAAKHPGGFIVRLHILGDFYSVGYARLWLKMMRRHSELRLFGFTGRPFDSPIGRQVAALNRFFPDRCRIRFSNQKVSAEWRSQVIKEASEKPDDAVICPAQTSATNCCATCALCWSSGKAIAFLEH